MEVCLEAEPELVVENENDECPDTLVKLLDPALSQALHTAEEQVGLADRCRSVPVEELVEVLLPGKKSDFPEKSHSR